MRIENFTRTFNEGRNTCSFEYLGKKYHGTGDYMHGACYFLYKGAHYKWEIFDESGAFMFSIGVTDSKSPLGNRFLKKCFRDFRGIK